MNARNLAKTLRTGGYDALARGLPARLERGDRLIEWRGVNFHFTTFHGLWECQIAADRVICDEYDVYITADKLRVPKASTTVRFELRLPHRDGDRLSRCSRSTGKSRSTLVRAALRAYLSARGF